MLCHDFIVYVLSWFHRKCFVKHERKLYVKTSSYMFCHDFIVYALSNMNVNTLSNMNERLCRTSSKLNVYVLSWFHRKCFVMTSSYMFCHDFIVNVLSNMNVNTMSNMNVNTMSNMNVNSMSKLHRICFVMISSYMLCQTWT